MQLKQIQCNSCGAFLDIDLSSVIAYCPYCGNRLLIDVGQLAEIVKEKEETKRFEIEQDYEDKQKERNHKLVIPIILLMIAIDVIIVISSK